MGLNKRYLAAFLILFIIEVIIALFIKDTIIRPYIGDILVVILMYTFIKGVVSKHIKHLPIYLFLFAAAVEFAQYFRIVELLNLQGNKAASILIGTAFDIKDIICYFTGAVILMIWEKLRKEKWN